MTKLPKIAFLYTARSLGLFAVARKFTANKLRVLCYHGVAMEDEHLFRPTLFISPLTLKKRLSKLTAAGYPLLGLGEACERLQSDSLPAAAVALTMDDGWYNACAEGLPVFGELNVPLTVYVTSSHMQSQIPVLDVTIAYLFWKSGCESFDTAQLEDPDIPPQQFVLPEQTVAAAVALQAAAKALDPDRQKALLANIAGILNVDVDSVLQRRQFHLMTPEEVKKASAEGIDIQLHTHSHHLDTEKPDDVARELAENRALLEPLVGKQLFHFCYPSGVHDEGLVEAVRAEGIRTATTVEPGLNGPQDDPLRLKRILDGEHLTQIEFEAEISGFSWLARRATGRA